MNEHDKNEIDNLVRFKEEYARVYTIGYKPLTVRRFTKLFKICGKCRHNTVMIDDKQLNYCGNCGQKIDWTD